MSAPIETKVKAATGGSTVGVALAGLILWLLDTYVFKTEPVPDPIVIAVWAILPIGLTFLAGYRAKHTSLPSAAEHRLLAADEKVGGYPGGILPPPSTRASGSPWPPGGSVT